MCIKKKSVALNNMGAFTTCIKMKKMACCQKQSNERLNIRYGTL